VLLGGAEAAPWHAAQSPFGDLCQLAAEWWKRSASFMASGAAFGGGGGGGLFEPVFGLTSVPVVENMTGVVFCTILVSGNDGNDPIDEIFQPATLSNNDLQPRYATWTGR